MCFKNVGRPFLTYRLRWWWQWRRQCQLSLCPCGSWSIVKTPLERREAKNCKYSSRKCYHRINSMWEQRAEQAAPGLTQLLHTQLCTPHLEWKPWKCLLGRGTLSTACLFPEPRVRGAVCGVHRSYQKKQKKDLLLTSGRKRKSTAPLSVLYVHPLHTRPLLIISLVMLPHRLLRPPPHSPPHPSSPFSFL